jgi:purine-binding chemotaxis protein CheW
MKKKRKNQSTNQPDSSQLEPAAPNPAGEAELEANLSAASLESEMEESVFEITEEPAMDLSTDAAIPAAEAMAAPEDLDAVSLEPMDELFNEMLAHEIDLAATEEVAPELALAAPVEEAAETLSAAEPILDPDEALLLQALSESESGLLDQPEVLAALERATAPDNQELEALVESAALEQFAESEPVAASNDDISTLLDGMAGQEMTLEAPEIQEAEPETPPQPLAPQPALEAVVGSIDRALEAAPAVISPTESVTQHHHQKQFSQLDDYVVFSLAGGDYAVPVRDVAEIGRVPAITRVPNVPEFVRGITNLRGEVVPVLNLPALLGLMESQVTARGRVLFLQARAEVSATGLLVDEVKGIQRIQSQQLEQVTGLVDDKVTSVLRGVYGRGDRLLNVLDLEQLFQLQEFRQLETV